MKTTKFVEIFIKDAITISEISALAYFIPRLIGKGFADAEVIESNKTKRQYEKKRRERERLRKQREIEIQKKIEFEKNKPINLIATHVVKEARKINAAKRLASYETEMISIIEQYDLRG